MRRVSFTVLFMVTLSAYAAKPVKITPSDAGSVDGQEYRNYIIECTNGKKPIVTSWSSGKRWCVGPASQENCAKKQIRAAKTACK